MDFQVGVSAARNSESDSEKANDHQTWHCWHNLAVNDYQN